MGLTQRHLTLALAAALAALAGCATPPVPETPTGQNRSPINTAQAIKEYSERSFQNGVLARENIQQKIIIAAQAKQAEELKSFITQKLVQQEMNKPKGVPNPDVAAVAKPQSTPTVIASDLVTAKTLARLDLIEQRLAAVQSYLPKLATAEEFSQLRQKLEAVEMRFDEMQKPIAIAGRAKPVIEPTPIAPAVVIAQIAPVTRYRFESDTTLLHLLERWALTAGYSVAFVGKHDLPIVPELKAVDAGSFREAFDKALAAYRSYDLNIVLKADLDDEKKLITVTTNLKADAAKTDESVFLANRAPSVTPPLSNRTVVLKPQASYTSFRKEQSHV